MKPHEFSFAYFMSSMYDIFAVVMLCANLCYVGSCYERTPLNVKVSSPVYFVMAMLVVQTTRAVALSIEPVSVFSPANNPGRANENPIWWR